MSSVVLVFSTLSEGIVDRLFLNALARVNFRSGITTLKIGASNYGRQDLLYVPFNPDPHTWEFTQNTVSSHPLSQEQIEKWVERCGHFAKSSAKETTGQDLLTKINGYADFCTGLFVDFDVRAVFVSNNSIPFSGIPFDIGKALSVSTFFFERGYLPNSYIVDAYGPAAFSKFAHKSLAMHENKDFYQSVGRQVKVELTANISGRRKQKDMTEQEQEFAQKERLLKVLFTPVCDDVCSTHPAWHTDAHQSRFHGMDSHDIADFLSSIDGVSLVVKPHPIDTSDWVGTDYLCVQSDISQWMKWADVIVTNGSSVEFLSLISGKPTVLTSGSALRGKQVAYELTSPDLASAYSLLTRSARIGLTHEMKQNFLSILGLLYHRHLCIINPVENDVSQKNKRLRIKFVFCEWLGRFRRRFSLRRKVLLRVQQVIQST